MLVDSHCHLDYLERDVDIDEAVQRARDGGIGTMLTICAKSPNSRPSARLRIVTTTFGARSASIRMMQQTGPARRNNSLNLRTPKSYRDRLRPRLLLKIRHKIKSVAFEPISPQRARPVYL